MNTKKSNPRVEKGVKCKKCLNDKAFIHRGESSPTYKYKCTKCGNKEY